MVKAPPNGPLLLLSALSCCPSSATPASLLPLGHARLGLNAGNLQLLFFCLNSHPAPFFLGKNDCALYGEPLPSHPPPLPPRVPPDEHSWLKAEPAPWSSSPQQPTWSHHSSTLTPLAPSPWGAPHNQMRNQPRQVHRMWPSHLPIVDTFLLFLFVTYRT